MAIIFTSVGLQWAAAAAAAAEFGASPKYGHEHRGGMSKCADFRCCEFVFVVAVAAAAAALLFVIDIVIGW